MKHQLALLFLWSIAVGITFFEVRDGRVLTILGPVFAVCMIGSVVILRAALRRPS